MPLENTGKVLKNVEKKKNKVILHFEDETLKISIDTFVRFYLYPNKEVSLEEIKQIKDYEELNTTRNYIKRIIDKNLYSEYQIRLKLINKEVTLLNRNKIIKELKEDNLINDERVASIVYEEYNHSNLGKNKIISELEKRKISQDIISRLEFDEALERLKLQTQAASFMKRMKKDTYKKNKDKLTNYLILKGFDNYLIYQELENLSSLLSLEDEDELFKKNKDKYLRTHHLDLKDPKVYQKVVNYFLRQGFHLDIIKRYL